MDLGGHRFFSKSDWVMDWWQDILPVAAHAEELRDAASPTRADARLRARRRATATPTARVMLVRPRLSRIYYRRRFFDYPLKLNRRHAVATSAWLEAARLGASYARATVFPRASRATLEDFFINRFGERLYLTFFKDYTEKVWGVPCNEITAEWGAQRIKGLSITKALAHALAQLLPARSADVAQKDVETSLIERFLYPKLGPGQMWEEVARTGRSQAGGADVRLRHAVVGIDRAARTGDRRRRTSGSRARARRAGSPATLCLLDHADQRSRRAASTPDDARICAGSPRPAVPRFHHRRPARATDDGRGRGDGAGDANGMPADNWIYIQEPDVKLGRLQIFNNWSPDLVADPDTVWLGLEYFCNEGDELWSMDDAGVHRLRGARAGEDRPHRPQRRARRQRSCACRRPTRPISATTRDIGHVRDYLDGIREPVPRRPQRHAPLQQPGPLDARGEGGGRLPRRRARRTRAPSGRSTPRRTTTRPGRQVSVRRRAGPGGLGRPPT